MNGDQTSRLALNLGCGEKIKHQGEDGYGWVNLDSRELPGVDVVHDLTAGIPFLEGTFDHILVDNVLEHFESRQAILLINEMDRVLKVGGTAVVILPHAMSQGAYQDPTHRSFWVPRSFLYWNQTQTPYGGTVVGITANFYPVDGPTVTGDMRTEAFIYVLLEKRVSSVRRHQTSVDTPCRTVVQHEG